MNFSLEALHSTTDELEKSTKQSCSVWERPKFPFLRNSSQHPTWTRLNTGNLKGLNFQVPFSLVEPFPPVIYIFANTFNCRGLNCCILVLITNCSWIFFRKSRWECTNLRVPNWYQGWQIYTKSIMVHFIKYKFLMKYCLFINMCFSKCSVAEYRMSSNKVKDSEVQCLTKVSLIADASAVAPDERDQCWGIHVDCTGSTKGRELK